MSGGASGIRYTITRFTGTKVRILTQKALLVGEGEDYTETALRELRYLLRNLLTLTSRNLLTSTFV